VVVRLKARATIGCCDENPTIHTTIDTMNDTTSYWLRILVQGGGLEALIQVWRRQSDVLEGNIYTSFR
jgi:hypothetical protein